MHPPILRLHLLFVVVFFIILGCDYSRIIKNDPIDKAYAKKMAQSFYKTIEKKNVDEIVKLTSDSLIKAFGKRVIKNQYYSFFVKAGKLKSFDVIDVETNRIETKSLNKTFYFLKIKANYQNVITNELLNFVKYDSDSVKLRSHDVENAN